jgi:hypothetical protein
MIDINTNNRHMVMRWTMKCPKCGSEYHSSAQTCYACGRLDRPAKRSWYSDWRKAAAFSTAATLIAAGIILILSAYVLVPDGDWKGLVVFGVFVASFGASVLSYSLLYTRTTLKDLRDGREPGNRVAAGMSSIGLGMMLFAASYMNAAYRIGFTPRLFGALGLVLPLSILLIIASLYRRPRFLFRKEEVEFSSSRRTRVGTSMLFIGFVVQVITFVYWYLAESLTALLIGSIWLLIGPFMVITAVAIMWGPMGRPWIPGRHPAESDSESVK